MSAHDLWILVLCLGAGVASAFLNTAAAAGSAVCLPILMLAGLDPVSANATNRIPVLIGSISGVATFAANKTLPWGIAIKASIPAALGSLLGAWLAGIVPGRDLGLMITATILVAFLMMFGKFEQAISRSEAVALRFGPREFALLFLVGIWTGFLVINGPIFRLFILVLMVGLPFVQANAVKNFTAIPTAIVSLAVFSYEGTIDWKLGAMAGVGSVIGGYLGARFASSPAAKRHVFYLLVVVLSGELVNLGVHYVFKTHG